MILFSAISKGSLILCEYTESNEDFQSLILKQLKFIKNNEEKQQFQINEYTLYHLQKNQYNFMCLLQQPENSVIEDQKTFAYQFLQDIADQFQLMTQSQGIDKGQFTKVIAEIMVQYNQKTENHVGQLKQEIQEIQTHQEINTQNMYQEPKGISKKEHFGYSIYTCKSIFFVINLFLAGMLVELFTKFDKYL
uniref:Synaptobrevin 4-1 n=1 Tax=Paramecium tetraurelia TaxID=5888 RepID=Q3SEQ1_PARTE|nr:synaptobrevin 4-1 [Paramecium tetraurelia]